MKKTETAKLAVQDFAGIDVSAHPLDVVKRRGVDDQFTIATFANSAAGHKALLRFLLLGKARVRVCVEASGNYTLDLAFTLQAHPQVEISVVNPRRARRFAESLGAQQDRPSRCTSAMRIRRAHAVGSLAATQCSCPARARHSTCHRRPE